MTDRCVRAWGVGIALCWCVAASLAYAQEGKAPPKAKDAPEKKDLEPSEKTPDFLSLYGTDGVEEILVTAARLETSLWDTPADANIVPGARLDRPGGKNFLDALSSVPGVRLNSRQENSAFTDIEVRGLSTNETSGGNLLILLDGIPQRRISFGGPYMGALPFEALSRMEMVKGPMSTEYGRGALAGALQLFSDAGSEEWHVKSSVAREWETDAEWGSVKVSGPVPATGGTFSLTTAGYFADGWQPRTEAQHGNFYLHYDQPLGEDNHLKVLGGIFDAIEHMASPVLIDRGGFRRPGVDRDTNLAVPGQNALDMTEYRLGVVFTHDFSETLESKSTVAYWHGDTFWKVGRPSDAPAAGTVVSRIARDLHWREDNWYLEQQVQQKYQISDDIKGALTAGGTAEQLKWESSVRDIRTRNSTFGQGIPIDLVTMWEPPPELWVYGTDATRYTRERDWGLFLTNKTDLYDRLDLDAGIRWDLYERIQRNITTQRRATVWDHAFSPSVGGLYHITEKDRKDVNLGIYSNWGLGFNPIFRNVASAEIVSLNPETSQSTEVGLKARACDNRIEGTVAFYELERIDVVGSNPNTLNMENLGNWVIRGIEFGTKLRPISDLSLYASYTLRHPTNERDARNPDWDGNDIPFVADQMLTLGGERVPKQGLGWALEGRFVDTCFADPANNIRLPPYWLLDASVSYYWKQARISLFAKNLLNEEYYSAVFQGVQYGSAFEGTPRTIGVQATVKF